MDGMNSCRYSLIPADCSQSWFFFIMALCDHTDSAPTLLSNGSLKYTLRREQLASSVTKCLSNVNGQESNLNRALELMFLKMSITKNFAILDFTLQIGGLTRLKPFSLK